MKGLGWRRVGDNQWEYWSTRNASSLSNPELLWWVMLDDDGDLNVMKEVGKGDAHGIAIPQEVLQALFGQINLQAELDREWTANALIAERNKADHERSRWKEAFNLHLAERTRRQRIVRSAERSIQRLRMLHEWLKQFGGLTSIKGGTALGTIETCMNDLQGAIVDET